MSRAPQLPSRSSSLAPFMVGIPTVSGYPIDSMVVGMHAEGGRYYGEIRKRARTRPNGWSAWVVLPRRTCTLGRARDES